MGGRWWVRDRGDYRNGTELKPQHTNEPTEGLSNALSFSRITGPSFSLFFSSLIKYSSRRHLLLQKIRSIKKKILSNWVAFCYPVSGHVILMQMPWPILRLLLIRFPLNFYANHQIIFSFLKLLCHLLSGHGERASASECGLEILYNICFAAGTGSKLWYYFTNLSV